MKTTILLVTLAVLVFRGMNNQHNENKQNVCLSAVNTFAAGNHEWGIMPEDTAFVSKAIQSNRGEIMMSQMALQKSSNGEIKALAQRMVSDHQQLVQQLQSLNGNKNNMDSSSMNNNPQMMAYTNLVGNDFDRKWISDMIMGHQKAISDFREELNRASNTQLKNLINNALPTMQDLLRQLEALRSKMM